MKGIEALPSGRWLIEGETCLRHHGFLRSGGQRKSRLSRTSNLLLKAPCFPYASQFDILGSNGA
jgi:hypothetical protein